MAEIDPKWPVCPEPKFFNQIYNFYYTGVTFSYL